MMRKKSVLVALFLSGCINSPEIQNDNLNDRVKACSAGFSENVQANLNASIDKAQLRGQIDGGIKEETRSIIFSQIPDVDRLKAYEDYIGCIERNWNNG
jgi:hypothetical protein